MVRVLLVAAYASVRAGLYALLAEAADCVVVGQVSGSGDLERLLPELRPDVVLLDAFPGEANRVMTLMAGGAVGLILLDDDPDEGRRLIRDGPPGRAWLKKDAGGNEIAGAIRAVVAGLIAIDPELFPLLTDRATIELQSQASDERLTAREREVLQLMAQGLPNKQIAARLSISLHTVKFHVAAILAKFGAASRTEAVTQGVRQGYVML